MIPPISRRSRRGFTLVELLVVIAIVAILGAITYPALTLAIARAKATKCAANLRSIGVAMLNFAGENNGNLPVSGGAMTYGVVDSVTGQTGWTEQLGPYVGNNRDVFQCPDSSKAYTANASYAYFNGSHAAKAGTPVNLMKMKSTTQHIMAGDIAFAGLFGATDTDKDDFTQDPAFNGATALPSNIPIHRGYSNILFADGHVKAFQYFDKTQMTTIYDGVPNNITYLTPAP